MGTISVWWILGFLGPDLVCQIQNNKYQSSAKPGIVNVVDMNLGLRFWSKQKIVKVCGPKMKNNNPTSTNE